MEQIIILRRKRHWENAKWDDYFIAKGEIDPEKAMRDAIREFLLTSEGLNAIEETSNDFNWGDAMVYIPEKLWNKHGLETLYEEDRVTTGIPIDIVVDQDEVLIPYDI